MRLFMEINFLTLAWAGPHSAWSCVKPRVTTGYQRCARPLVPRLWLVKKTRTFFRIGKSMDGFRSWIMIQRLVTEPTWISGSGLLRNWNTPRLRSRYVAFRRNRLRENNPEKESPTGAGLVEKCLDTDINEVLTAFHAGLIFYRPIMNCVKIISWLDLDVRSHSFSDAAVTASDAGLERLVVASVRNLH